MLNKDGRFRVTGFQTSSGPIAARISLISYFCKIHPEYMTAVWTGIYSTIN